MYLYLFARDYCVFLKFHVNSVSILSCENFGTSLKWHFKKEKLKLSNFWTFPVKESEG